MRTQYLNSVFLIAFLTMAGCGSNGTTPCNCPDSQCNIADAQDSIFYDNGLDSNAEDVSIFIDLGQDTARDVTFDGEIQPGGFGSACESNKDCESGYCIETPDGYACTNTCVTDCPEGWDCRTTMIGQDLVSICIPAGVTLCRPCKLDTQCGGGHCVKMDGKAYCGLDCKDDENCPRGYSCKEMEPNQNIDKPTVMQCVPDTLSCDCNLLTQGKQRVCERKNDYGRCFGYETCDAIKGWVGCDAPEPMVEECNGLDDNCNGITDEFAKPPEYPCEKKVDGIGTCKGNWECKDGGWVCDAATPEAEKCDGLDNDCNGRIDDLWSDLGKPCYVGVGACTSIGASVCNATMDGVECQGTPGQPSDEKCNYIDDDCDGKTDEDFKDASGVYNDDHFCGNCYTDCSNLWDPVTNHANGKCLVKNEVPRCGYECVASYADADTNPDNGCELFIDPDAIYVSVPANNGSDVGTCGTWDAPCASIGYGLDRANSGGMHKVLVSEGIYPENVVMKNGISLKGGFNAVTWQEAPDTNITIIQGRSSAGTSHTKAVIANGITQATTLSGFTIYGENNYSGNSGNSYGIYVKGSDTNLVIENNIVYAGMGAKGGDGTPGKIGDKGHPGKPGNNGWANNSASCSGSNPGGARGTSTCGAAGGAGGAGGCPFCTTHWEFLYGDVVDSCFEQHTGVSGSGAGHGNGGKGGYNYYVDASNTCNTVITNSVSAIGKDGTPGDNGIDGQAGSGCTDANGTMKSDEWTPAKGGSGNSGTAGAGGGGGGSGGGVAMVNGKCLDGYTFGGSGGGGGAGGCGGIGGSPGLGGGASIAIMVICGNSGCPVIKDNLLIRNSGGNGGPGGNGGLGGAGASGGAGGLEGSSNYAWAVGTGGHGGNGGNGGNGGGGGGGCGGPSYGILVVGSGSYCANNTFDHLGDGGKGGKGGLSNGHPGSNGVNGQAVDCKTL